MKENLLYTALVPAQQSVNFDGLTAPIGLYLRNYDPRYAVRVTVEVIAPRPFGVFKLRRTK